MKIYLAIAFLGVLCLFSAIVVYWLKLKAREKRAMLAREGKGSLMDFADVDNGETETEPTVQDFKSADELALDTRRLHFKDGLFEINIGLLLLPYSWLHLTDNYIAEKYQTPVHIASAGFLIAIALAYAVTMAIKNIRHPETRPGMGLVIGWVLYSVGVFILDLTNVIWAFPILAVGLSYAMYRHTQYKRAIIYAVWSIIAFPIALVAYPMITHGTETAVDWVYIANIALFTLAPTFIGIVVAVKHFSSLRREPSGHNSEDLTTAMEGSN